MRVSRNTRQITVWALCFAALTIAAISVALNRIPELVLNGKVSASNVPKFALCAGIEEIISRHVASLAVMSANTIGGKYHLTEEFIRADNERLHAWEAIVVAASLGRCPTAIEYAQRRLSQEHDREFAGDKLILRDERVFYENF